jgi:hypothetical protein
MGWESGDRSWPGIREKPKTRMCAFGRAEGARAAADATCRSAVLTLVRERA